MCGLLLAYASNIDIDNLEYRCINALALIKHRGPDQQRIVKKEKAVLGHARLSVIDVKDSIQPMSNTNGNYTLVFNGEIYNYQELRQSLSKVWTFKTQGDTEVVLAGLIKQGISFLSKMEGMWALAFWDNERESVILSRDRFGKKPLYYCKSNHHFYCASEIPALQAIDQSQWEEDYDSTADYFRYGFTIPGYTAFKDILEVPPAHTLSWSPVNGVKLQQYWNLSYDTCTLSRNEAMEKLQHLLIESIKKRLVADVEVGAFLSGGIDSSLIVSILVEKLQMDIKTFTIGFDNSAYDESKYAAIVANLYGTSHHIELFEKITPEFAFDLIKNHIGQPFSDSSLFPYALLSSVAATHVKVALSGDGADEVFSGYQRYQARIIYNWYIKLPKYLRENLTKVMRLIPEPMIHHSHSIIKKAKLFLDLVEEYGHTTNYIAPPMLNHAIFNEICPALKHMGHSNNTSQDFTSIDDIKKMMSQDMLMYLPQDIMQKSDRASMAHSLEVRSPYLDTELVEFSFTLPRNWHRSNFIGKKMLRKSFKNSLPDAIWQRRKQGFSIPMQKWFIGELSTEIMGFLNNLNTPLNINAVEKMIKIHRSGSRDYSLQLWGSYCYLMWLSSRLN